MVIFKTYYLRVIHHMNCTQIIIFKKIYHIFFICWRLLTRIMLRFIFLMESRGGGGGGHSVLSPSPTMWISDALKQVVKSQKVDLIHFWKKGPSPRGNIRRTTPSVYIYILDTCWKLRITAYTVQCTSLLLHVTVLSQEVNSVDQRRHKLTGLCRTTSSAKWMTDRYTR